MSVITAVYRKSLRLSMSAKQADTVGNCLNLMAVDARRLNDWLPYLHNMWSSPLQIVISMVMLWEQIGPAVLAVSCHDIAAIWVAFFSRWQRYRC